MKTSVLIGGIIAVGIILIIGYLVSRTSSTDQLPTISVEEEGQPINLTQSPATTVVTGLTTNTPSVSPTPTTTTTPIAATEKAISITDTGFSPATITVPVNTTVTFTNNGQGQHWPASEVHPTHQILPGFDARQGLATGETYSFTFTEKGSWKFHDHLNPRLTGTIVVQ